MQEVYESIEEKEYNKQIKKLGKLSFGVIQNEEAEIDKFCNNDSCEQTSVILLVIMTTKEIRRQDGG